MECKNKNGDNGIDCGEIIAVTIVDNNVGVGSKCAACGIMISLVVDGNDESVSKISLVLFGIDCVTADIVGIDCVIVDATDADTSVVTVWNKSCWGWKNCLDQCDNWTDNWRMIGFWVKMVDIGWQLRSNDNIGYIMGNVIVVMK